MGTGWHETTRDELSALLARFRDQYGADRVKVLEAAAIVKDKGAFVEIDSEETARDLFLPEVVVLHSSRTVRSYEDCMGSDFRHGCFVAGESQTADIEQVLVSGVHGPKECIFVLVQ